MQIFSKDEQGKWKQLSPFVAQKEKDIQSLIEYNLMEILELHFLEREYNIAPGRRIDTLAVDKNGAPVIIEYKKEKNNNIITQGLSYLKWLKAQKKEFFEMLVSKKLVKGELERVEIDWKNPRVICIADSFHKYDTDAVEVIHIRIELYEYKFYNDNLFSLNPLNLKPEPIFTSFNVKPDSTPTSLTNLESQSNNEAILNKRIERSDENIKELFWILRENILGIDESVVEKVTTMYVAYRSVKNFAEVHIGRNQFTVYLRSISYVDPLGKIEQIPDSFQWTLNKRVYLKSKEDLEYVLSLVEQSYRDVS